MLCLFIFYVSNSCLSSGIDLMFAILCNYQMHCIEIKEDVL